VLDEADRCLDMGFAKCLNAILANLPTARQTLLFSATQTKSVKDLARLSLNNPEYVAPRADNAPVATMDDKTTTLDVPAGLEQYYMVVPLDKKIDHLFSFVKTHLQSKAIVFASSSKQVRFLFETLRHMRPGIPLMHLYGRQKQATRLDTYTRFSNSKHAILFATDVAARGLDFPAVDWVIQLDCPEDSATYVHRVGRTARYQRKGSALLFLLPSEEGGMTARLSDRGIAVKALRAKESKLQSIQGLLQSYAFQYPEIKNLAQRAFISYVRSVYLQSDKTVFKLDDLPLDAFATSLGLAGAPQIRFPSKAATSQKKNASRDLGALKSGSESEGDEVVDSVFDGRARQPLPSQSKMHAEVRPRALHLSPAAPQLLYTDAGGPPGGQDQVRPHVQAHQPERPRTALHRSRRPGRRDGRKRRCR
jgi:ATP-dependent RNA helicase DDX10/DBP4